VGHLSSRSTVGAALLVASCARGGPPGASTTPLAAPLELDLERALPIAIEDDFQPSGLAIRQGHLITVSDKHDTGVYEIVPGDSSAALRPFVTFAPPGGTSEKLDLEGIAVDEDGSLLLASEEFFRVLRVSMSGEATWLIPSVETLGQSVGLFQKDNADLEGVARLPDGGLLLAAEREPRGLIELSSSRDGSGGRAWAMPRSIYPVPAGRRPDFADLAVADGKVYALERNSHLVVRLERTKGGWEEREAWSYARTENDRRYAYENAAYGVAEGLAIDGDHVFLVTDNNRLGRREDLADHRPLLFVFARPGR
jgi:Esterase-like activity of phytase